MEAVPVVVFVGVIAFTTWFVRPLVASGYRIWKGAPRTRQRHAFDGPESVKFSTEVRGRLLMPRGLSVRADRTWLRAGRLRPVWIDRRVVTEVTTCEGRGAGNLRLVTADGRYDGIVVLAGEQGFEVLSALAGLGWPLSSSAQAVLDAGRRPAPSRRVRYSAALALGAGMWATIVMSNQLAHDQGALAALIGLAITFSAVRVIIRTGTPSHPSG